MPRRSARLASKVKESDEDDVDNTTSPVVITASASKSSKNDFVRFVTYNVLSSNLCSASWYAKNDPEHLDPRKRLPKVFAKLSEEIKENAIIGLQEISITWSTKFRAFFEKNGYYFHSTHYGGSWSDYMGVALAYPKAIFELLDSAVFCPPSRPKWARAPKPKPDGALARVGRTVVNVAAVLSLSSLWLPFLRDPKGCCSCKKSGAKKKALPPLDQAKKRWNRMVCFKLKRKDRKRSDEEEGSSFVVSCYHMPCVYWDHRVMTIHAALMAQAAETFAGDDVPHVMLGDYNFPPGSAPYRLLTKGDLSKDDKDYPPLPSYETWRPRLKRKLRSAYAESSEGKEPSYTNYAHSGKPPQTFCGTLDYIFYAGDCGIETVATIPLPEFEEGKTRLCPNEDEPSDHLIIGATLDFGGR